MTASDDMILDELPVRLTQEMFNELAKSVWYARLGGKDEDMPDIPTVIEFQGALIDGDLNDGLTEFHARMHHVAKVSFSKFMGEPLTLRVGSKTVLPLAMTDLILEIDRDPTRMETVGDMETFVNALGLGVFHAEWEARSKRDPEVKHPIAPLVEAWFKRPKLVELSSKRAGIIPAQMTGNRALDYLVGLPPVEPPMGAQEAQLVILPAIAQPRASVIPTVVFHTWASAGGTMTTRGHGAPLSMRIFFEVITEMPRDARKRGGRRRLEMTLRDLRDRLYPRANGQRHDFRPTRDIANIHAALHEVDQMRVPMRYGQHNKRGSWRPVSVTFMPEPDLDSSIVLDIEVPPGTGGGAMIDRFPMRYYGLKSGPKYAASIGLAYYWDKYGTHGRGTRPIQATRPRVWRNEKDQALGTDSTVLLDDRHQPIRTYNDDRLVFLDEAGQAVQGATLKDRRAAAARERNVSVNLYPPLVSADILELFYPKDGTKVHRSTRRTQLQRAKAALDAMTADGYCIIEETAGTLGDPAYRILPTDWDNFSIR